MAAPEIELCWGNAPGAPLEVLARAAAAHGIHVIAVRPEMVRAARRAGRSDTDIKAELDSIGVAITVLDPLIGPLPGSPALDAVAPENRSYFETTTDDAIAMARAYGIGLVNMAHWLCDPATPLERLSHAVAGIAAKGRSAGVRTAIEFIPNTGVPNLAAATNIVQAVGLGKVGIMFDTWHFARTGGTVEQLRDLPPGAVFGLQFSDCTAESAPTPQAPLTGRLAPGEGELPLADMLRVLLADHPDLRVGIEVFNQEQRTLPPEKAVERVVAPMRRVLAAL
jgi:sugar phosphate isomerase/epimerase